MFPLVVIGPPVNLGCPRSSHRASPRNCRCGDGREIASRLRIGPPMRSRPQARPPQQHGDAFRRTAPGQGGRRGGDRKCRPLATDPRPPGASGRTTRSPPAPPPQAQARAHQHRDRLPQITGPAGRVAPAGSESARLVALCLFCDVVAKPPPAAHHAGFGIGPRGLISARQRVQWLQSCRRSRPRPRRLTIHPGERPRHTADDPPHHLGRHQRKVLTPQALSDRDHRCGTRSHTTTDSRTNALGECKAPPALMAGHRRAGGVVVARCEGFPRVMPVVAVGALWLTFPAVCTHCTHLTLSETGASPGPEISVNNS